MHLVLVSIVSCLLDYERGNVRISAAPSGASKRLPFVSMILPMAIMCAEYCMLLSLLLFIVYRGEMWKKM